MTDQRLDAPVLGDEGEQPMLDPVPPDAIIRAQALSLQFRPVSAWQPEKDWEYVGALMLS